MVSLSADKRSARFCGAIHGRGSGRTRAFSPKRPKNRNLQATENTDAAFYPPKRSAFVYRLWSALRQTLGPPPAQAAFDHQRRRMQTFFADTATAATSPLVNAAAALATSEDEWPDLSARPGAKIRAHLIEGQGRPSGTTGVKTFAASRVSAAPHSGCRNSVLNGR